MNKINVGRVLLGGLLAGLVMNIGEFLLNGVLLAKSMEEDFRRLNITPPGADPAFITKAVLMTFLLGIAVVYLYAAIRPRFGSGVKTAICAGLIAWFFVYVYVGVINGSIGLVSWNLILIGIVWGIFEYTIGAVAGAWLYKEAE
jgi:hypothetical protein